MNKSVRLHYLIVQVPHVDKGVEMLAERLRIQKGIVGVRRNLTVDKLAAILKTYV